MRWLGEEPQSGSLFIFANRGATRLKALWFDVNGYCLLYKRLHRALFELPASSGGALSVPSRPSWCPPRCAARRAAGSPFAGDPPILYAALAGRAIRGAITPNIAAVLRGEKAPDDALARELGAMGLL
ncbi:IS66 family insertion sequence element accessory protein TnpB [Sorangium sp. So ce1000]|uniref:IS66 family insertion sequence element accessory protein TnpB n=1 Tax=Sorangium sp. So ce1000 TaxID=3133325 RepID=UPI003F626535